MNHICLLRFAACSLLLAAQTLAAQPLVHLRADSLLADTNGRVSEWRSVTGNAVFAPGAGFTSPLVVRDGMNGRPTLRFANDGYLEGPAVFPTAHGYTLYVVMRWDGGSASNNLVSGNSRALFLASTPYPRVLHDGNFNQLAQSSVACNGPTVIRVVFNDATQQVRLAINNTVGDEAVIPHNTDATMFIGSYARGNFFFGDISEVILFDRLLDSTEQFTFENELHTRYGIARAPDPLPPLVQWDVVPSSFQFFPEGGRLVAKGKANVANGSELKRIVATLDVSGAVVEQWVFDMEQTTQININSRLTDGLYLYRFRVEAEFSDGSKRVIVDATDMVCGTAIAIEGQSNSIFGDASMSTNPFARTFGGNFSQDNSDTAFSPSVASGTGGGANVGAWGLRMQHLIANELGMPTCVINGGVGGTLIQQHFPDANNRMNLSTIYGSWLYRIDKSNLRDHIRWLFWYQGESNSGTDDYATLFATLYAEWKKDLPNLQHVVVVQIRPGCGGEDHARLRDDQRKLQDTYDDVIVHTACALPAHDGCHFASAGYRDLGDQLYRLYRDTEDGIPTDIARAPTVAAAQQDESTRNVSITMNYAKSMHVLQPAGEPLKNAFFFNGIETLRSDSAWIVGNTVVLRPPSTTSISTVSYVPAKNDPYTNALYTGPWLTDEVGVGALSFHNVAVIPSTVQSPEDGRRQTAGAESMRVVRRGETIEFESEAKQIAFADIHGREIVLETDGHTITFPTNVSPGVYSLLAPRSSLLDSLLAPRSSLLVLVCW